MCTYDVHMLGFSNINIEQMKGVCPNGKNHLTKGGGYGSIFQPRKFHEMGNQILFPYKSKNKEKCWPG